MLAPPVYIDGWATPWYRFLRPVLYAVPGLPRRMKIEEEDPFGIKNEQLRAIVKAKFERGENFHYRWVPLECIRQVDRLRAMVMKAASHIRCPTLVVHAREDELTSLRSAHFMVEAIGGGRARMVILEDSYHMICVDNDREIVAKNVLEFLGAALPGAGSALANEPRMSVDELTAALNAVLARLGAGELANLRELAIPDLSWVHPGANAVSGAHVGKAFGSFASRFGALGNAALHCVRHAGFQSRRRARARAARGEQRFGSPRIARRACCSRFTPESFWRRAGSRTRSSSRMRSSERRRRLTTRPSRSMRHSSRRRWKPRR